MNDLMQWMGAVGLGLSIAPCVLAQSVVPSVNAVAVKLNNRGVAQMGQQFTDRAAGSFAEAFKKDPNLAQAAINEGIALDLG